MRSKAWIVIPVLAVGLFAAFAFSQEAAKDPDVKGLIEKLGDQDFEAREEAKKAILALGEKAADALRAAAKSHPDAHVRAEADVLLKRLAKPSARLRPRGEGLAGEVKDMKRRFEELLKRLEGLGLLGGADIEELLRRLPRGPAKGGSSSSAVVRGVIDNGEERLEYEQRADGTIKITITKDGKSEVHEAKSLDDLKAKAPKVHAKVAPHFGRIRIHLDPRADPFEDWPRADDWDRFRPGSRPARPLRPRGGLDLDDIPGGFRLGVWVGEIGEALRVHLKLKAEEGVLIEQVVPGSLADRVGVKRLDVIRTINGIPTGSALAIRKAVAGLAKGGVVKLEIIRRGDPMALEGKR